MMKTKRFYVVAPALHAGDACAPGESRFYFFNQRLRISNSLTFSSLPKTLKNSDYSCRQTAS